MEQSATSKIHLPNKKLVGVKRLMFVGWSKLVAEGGEFEILIFLKRMIV